MGPVDLRQDGGTRRGLGTDVTIDSISPVRDRSLHGKEVYPIMMSQLLAVISSSRRDEEGQGLAEYALILALIAIIAIIALIFLGNQVSTILSDVGNSV